MLIDSLRYIGNHSGMTVRESPDEHAPEDDKALLIAALDHSWAWYDGRRQRAVELINYYLVATAILLTAYTSAINGKHYGIATALALAGLGLTALTATGALNEARAGALAVPALTELQDRIADRLSIGMFRFMPQTRANGPAVAIALGLATLLNIGALIYALVRL